MGEISDKQEPAAEQQLYARISQEDLASILEAHRDWVLSRGKIGACTNLAKADLGFAQLQGAILSKAQLQGASFVQADLQKADLREAWLQEANLFQAQLQGADLFEARLQGAYLAEAQLQRADLSRATFEKQEITDNDQHRSDLPGADLTFAEGFI